MDLLRCSILSALCITGSVIPPVHAQSVSQESTGQTTAVSKLVTVPHKAPAPELDQRWVTPLQENERFFTAPELKITASPRPSTEANQPRRAVKLLGIASVGDSNDVDIQAVLKVDDRMIYKKVGETIDEIEVIDIGLRSITLQSQGERWTIDLANQPVINKAQSTNRSVTSNSPRRAKVVMPIATSRAAESNLPTLSEPKVHAPVPETATATSMPKLPELDLPPLPNLPNFESTVTNK